MACLCNNPEIDKKSNLNYTDDDKFNVILMNPPYGGSEKKEIQNHFPIIDRTCQPQNLL